MKEGGEEGVREGRRSSGGFGVGRNCFLALVGGRGPPGVAEGGEVFWRVYCDFYVLFISKGEDRLYYYGVIFGF